MKTNLERNMGELIKKLEIASIIIQLPKGFTTKNNAEFSEQDIRALIGYTSILSLSDVAAEISLSYEIMARLLECTKGESQHVISAADIILSRIGNFPSRTLLRDRYIDAHELSISPALKLERVVREVENSISINENNDVLLTDFQYKFYSSLNDEDSLSISAPTSAGKSFVLNLDLVRKIKAKAGQSIVYVVPTRALISEVSNRIRTTLRNEGLGNVIVRTAPFPVAAEKIEQAVVYVLTQERLMSLINSQEGKPNITSLIVDEAHEIQNGNRGIILQNAIDISLSRFDSVKVLFASPLIKNPSYFLSLFGRTESGRFFVETTSPVSQNILLVSEVPRKTQDLAISLLSREQTIPICVVQTKFKFRDKKPKQRANLALSISAEKDSVISFSNTSASAESIACEIADMVTSFEPTDEILAFADFLKKEIHPEYPLADCIKKGVAFHYGRMPSLVRSGVENLFKTGQVKIICCTSTLLQGVNLPAKHIIIENPKSGDTPMSRADFLNLAGRAGRLLHEFHGNIWCIRPNDWSGDCYKGDPLQKITSAISNIMEDGGLVVQELLNNTDEAKNNKDDAAEAAFGKLYHDYRIDPEGDFIEKYRNDDNSKNLDKTLAAIENIQISLPLEILENNQSLRPDHLQRLYERLQNEHDILAALPMSPYVEGAKLRMEEIFKIIINCFEWDVSDRYMSWISYLAYMWVRSEPINKILSKRVNNQKEKGSTESVSSIIRGCLKVLEDAVRFRLVKYFSAYIEILRFVASERGFIEEFERIEPYHIYLEFGSCDRHALNLMALGISRFTALRLKGKFDLSDDVEAEAYLEILSRMKLETTGMPQICIKEIRDLIG